MTRHIDLDDDFFRARSMAPRIVSSMPVVPEPPAATPPTTSPTQAAPVPAPAASQPPRPQRAASRGINHAKAHLPQQARTSSWVKNKHLSAVAHVKERPDAAPNHLRSRRPQQPQTYPLEQRLATTKKVSSTINHVQSRKPQRARTLMRRSVTRPAPSVTRQLHPQSPVKQSASIPVAIKTPTVAVKTERLVRAKQVVRSPKVTHHVPTVATLDSMPVVSHLVPPKIATTKVAKPTPAPVAAPAPRPAPAKPAPTPKPPVAAPVPKRPAENIFDHALTNASGFVDLQARKTGMKKKARLHVASMIAGSLALLVIIGFAVYQNTPGLQLKVAGMRAGVTTSMPNFKAAGFAYNGVKVGNGKLTIGFKGPSGSYELDQQTTNLSGDEMIQNISGTDASGKPNYESVVANGITVYRFSNTNATWVKNGIWYVVSGNGVLSNGQLKSLVTNV